MRIKRLIYTYIMKFKEWNLSKFSKKKTRTHTEWNQYTRSYIEMKEKNKNYNWL